jgi:hypothetical protein
MALCVTILRKIVAKKIPGGLWSQVSRNTHDSNHGEIVADALEINVRSRNFCN